MFISYVIYDKYLASAKSQWLTDQDVFGKSKVWLTLFTLILSVPFRPLSGES